MEDFTCDCGRMFNNKYSFGLHQKRYCNSNIKITIDELQQEYDSGLSIQNLIDKYKLPGNYVANNIKSRTTSEAGKLAHKKYPEKFKHSDEVKEKIRQGKFAYYKKKTGDTPWDRRQRREFSYLENWFKDECIIKNKLQDKYDIIYEYAEYPYFIDFAFLNIKLAVELDGQCHFKNGVTRLQHDIDRDMILVNKGWKVYRIRYDQVSQETIDKFLIFLETEILKSEPKVYGDNLYKYVEINKKEKLDREKHFKNIRTKYDESQIKYIDLLMKSEIDFYKHGWVQHVAKMINQPTQHVHKWMKRMIPDFYETCFKRKKCRPAR